MSGVQGLLLGTNVALQPVIRLDAAYYASTTSAAELQLRSDGTVYVTVDSATTYEYNWLTNGVGSNYDVRATIVSGTFTSGTAGSWLNLGTTRSWLRNALPGTIQIVTADFEIRNATTLIVLATAQISLQRDNI